MPELPLSVVYPVKYQHGPNCGSSMTTCYCFSLWLFFGDSSSYFSFTFWKWSWSGGKWSGWHLGGVERGTSKADWRCSGWDDLGKRACLGLVSREEVPMEDWSLSNQTAFSNWLGQQYISRLIFSPLRKLGKRWGVGRVGRGGRTLLLQNLKGN